ncbi:MAG: redoxin, partial [Flavobacteriaceae bacterium]|nr:redoxin [Flavobacteriaceae bacterium]
SGKWKVVFNPGEVEEYNAVGIFDQNGSKISGTFRTTTGDYGFMEGVSEGNSVMMSTFNGARSYLFKGNLENDSITGYFYRGNYDKIPFKAFRDEEFSLPNPNSLTVMNDSASNRFKFSFKDSRGVLVSDYDSIFDNKVVVIQIMGTWCPNCLDETVFISDFIKKNNYKDLRFVSLAFEYAKTKQKAIENINKLEKRFDIKYPILLAQYGTSNKVEAQKKLPSLNQVISYPTLIFIDRNKNVRRIHTGFNGPATGKKYEKFKNEFKDLVIKLIEEN